MASALHDDTWMGNLFFCHGWWRFVGDSFLPIVFCVRFSRLIVRRLPSVWPRQIASMCQSRRHHLCRKYVRFMRSNHISYSRTRRNWIEPINQWICSTSATTPNWYALCFCVASSSFIHLYLFSPNTHTHTHARITYSYSVFWPRDQDEDHRPNKPLAGGCDALSIWKINTRTFRLQTKRDTHATAAVDPNSICNKNLFVLFISNVFGEWKMARDCLLSTDRSLSMKRRREHGN